MNKKQIHPLAIALALCALGCVGIALYNDYKDGEKADKVVKVTQAVQQTVASFTKKMGERVTLPDTSAQWYCTVVMCKGAQISSTNPYANIESWFDTDPRLRELKSITVYNVYDRTDPLYVGKVAPWLRKADYSIPYYAVAVQDGNGHVAYIKCDTDLPTCADELADDIATFVDRFKEENGISPNRNHTPAQQYSGITFSDVGWFRPNCTPYYPDDCPDCRPRPQPQPQPTPQPDFVRPVVIPDLSHVNNPVVTQTKEISSGAMLAAGLILGAIVMLFVYLQRDVGAFGGK